MSNAATIMVRLLGETVDCWLPALADTDGSDLYRIVGPQPNPDECREFRLGEVVRCAIRDGQLVATELVESGGTGESPDSGDDEIDLRRRALADSVGLTINETDPIGFLAMGAPEDEYAAEVSTILPRLPAANDAVEVTSILHDEFCHWFGSSVAGSRDAYEEAGRRIWDAVRRYRYDP